MKKKILTELSQDTIDIIKELSPLINSKSLDITHKMFNSLFKKYPHLKVMFKNTEEDHHILLAEAFSTFAVNIDNLKILELALYKIAGTHTSLYVMPEHYMVLGQILMNTIEDVIGEELSLKQLDAIREGFKYISSILIEMERKIYLEMIRNSLKPLSVPMTIR